MTEAGATKTSLPKMKEKEYQKELRKLTPSWWRCRSG